MELRQGCLAPSPSSTVGHRLPSVVSLRGQEDAAAGPPQDSNPGPSSLDYLSGLDTQPGEVRVIPNSRLCLYRHTLSNRSGVDVPSSGPVQRSSQACSSDFPGKVCYSSGLSVTAGEVGINVRSGALRPSQVSASSAVPLSSLAPQPGSANRKDPLGSSFLGPVSETVDQA